MILEPLDVVVTPGKPGSPGFPGKPDKADCRFFFADGTEWTGPVTSPSAENKYDACERKWGLYAIDKVETKEKASTALGKRAHAELEEWLTNGTYPKYERLVNAGVLEEFPQPKHPDLKVERVFAFAFSPNDLFEEVVVWWGFKDAEFHDEVMDLKSTGNIVWAKSAEELSGDTQGNVYAMDNILTNAGVGAWLKWVYFTTKGPLKKLVVRVWRPLEAVVSVLTERHANASEMRDHRLNPATTGMSLSPNALHCGDFGGCDYINICKLKARDSFMSLVRQSRLEKARKEGVLETPTTGATAPTEKKMGVIAAMQQANGVVPKAGATVPVGNKPPVNKAPAAKPATAAAAKPATTKPATAPAAKPATTPAKPATATAAKPATVAAKPATTAPSAKGALRSVLAKPAAAVVEEAEGVNPPDAPEAQAQDEDAVDPNAAAEGEVAEGDVVEEGADEGGEALEEVVEEEPPPPPPKKAPAPPPKPAAAKPATAAAKPATTTAKPAAAKPAATAKPAAKETAVLAEGEPQVFAQFVLYLDAMPVKGPEAFSIKQIDDIITPAREQVESESQQNVNVIEFGNGWKFVAAQLEANIRADKPVGRFFCSSRIVERPVLEVLMRFADVVLKGGY